MPDCLLYHKSMQAALLILGIIPLFFLPFTLDFYDMSKWTLLVLIALLTLISTSWSWLKASRIHLTLPQSLWGVGGLLVASLVSLLFASSNRVEAVLQPLGPTTYAAIAAVFILTGSWGPRHSRMLLWSLMGSVSFLGLIAIYQFFGVGKFMFPGTAFLADRLWTPTGSALATFTLFLITLPIFWRGTVEAHKHKRDRDAAILIIAMVVIIMGAALIAWQMLAAIGRSLLSIPNGWAVMLEILKAPKQAIVGVGVENFLTAFSASRPAHLNLTPLWDARYTVSTNTLFHMVTIYGLVGAAGISLLFRSILMRSNKNPFAPSLIVGLIVLLLTPPNFSVIIAIFALLLLADHLHEPKRITMHAPSWATWSVFTIVIIAGSLTLYSLTRTYLADIAFARSLATANKGDGKATYDLQIRAISLNRRIPKYHMTYSQTNLALATSLAREISTNATMTEEDKTKNRELIAQLIQQAIREGKLAISLNPNSVFAWENLARIYRQLVGVAQGADQWAVTTYIQAIRLDPTNPLLSLELGGVYVQMKNYTDAITQFTRAVNLKPDYANAWYNLANAYRLAGDTANRIKALEKAQTLVDASTSEYRIVREELEDARNPKSSKGEPEKSESASGSATLTTPTPAPVLVPPLDVID